MQTDMDNATYDRIMSLCSEGDDAMDADNFDTAYEKYISALELIPDPLTDWEASTWILAALGDLYYFAEDYEQSINALTDAACCPGGHENPFIRLRLGQCYFELGEMDRAADELTRAYRNDGLEIFEDEEEKYLMFLKTRITINPS